MTSEREQAHHDDVPIHPDRLLKDLVTVLDPSATLVVEPFKRLAGKDQAAVGAEGAALLKFSAADVQAHDVQIAPAPAV
jgi:hypothetical protein